jgi:hypothetical protein
MPEPVLPLMEDRHRREYETTYNYALMSLRLRYVNVGLPYTNAHGERRCEVNGLPRTDHELFKLLWGPKEADRICGLLP